MGDRATIYFHGAGYETAGVYLHWDGSRVVELLEAAQPRMRISDPSYAAARFVQHVANDIDKNDPSGPPLSIGIVPNGEGHGRQVYVNMDTGEVSGDVKHQLDVEKFYNG